MTVSQVNRLRGEYVKALVDLEPTLFVTLVLGLEIRPDVAAERCREFLKRVERRAHGKRWSHRPADQRLKAYGFIEHVASNLHYHLMIAGPHDVLLAVLSHGERIWLSLRRSGQFDAQVIEDPTRVARYITKELTRMTQFEHVLVY